jgi:hypothetical protein
MLTSNDKNFKTPRQFTDTAHSWAEADPKLGRLELAVFASSVTIIFLLAARWLA